MRIAIIGAGMAGMACARQLHAAGLAVTVYDKGRGLGGRMATRRGDGGLQFDHGAQYVTARDARFDELLTEARRAGYADTWEFPGLDEGKRAYVGLPGMTGIVKFMAQGLSIQRQHEVTRIEANSHIARIEANGADADFDRVVCTAPAPQAAALLGDDHPLAPDLARITYAPCLTLMVGMTRRIADHPVVSRDRDADLTWIARDNAKPKRGSAESWVAQASEDWSAAHLEDNSADLMHKMTDLFVARTGADPTRISHAETHRWRYAKVTAALDTPFLRSADKRIYVGGDGMLGPRVEAAYHSGTAIAADILASLEDD